VGAGVWYPAGITWSRTRFEYCVCWTMHKRSLVFGIQLLVGWNVLFVAILFCMTVYMYMTMRWLGLQLMGVALSLFSTASTFPANGAATLECWGARFGWCFVLMCTHSTHLGYIHSTQWLLGYPEGCIVCMVITQMLRKTGRETKPGFVGDSNVPFYIPSTCSS
jgi:hypothetical protein